MFVCLVRDSLSPSRPGVLEAVARACSPRVEPHGPDAVVCDATGLARVLGTPAAIAEEMRRMAWEQEVGVRIAIAGTKMAAWLLAHARPGITLVPAGEQAQRLERLPLSVLLSLPDQPRTLTETLAIFDRWGMLTLGDLARLPRADVRARMGSIGVRLHQAACGEDDAPMVPADEPPQFVERMELEWPIDGLEPLSFVLARMCDALSTTLTRADRGAVTLTTRLRLVTKATHVRTLTLPSPIRESRTLRTLILLDLEGHPAPAGIDVVEIECSVTPGRVAQGSLLAYTVPTPEDLSTLIARLSALVGEARVGAPVVVDTHNPRVSAMKPFVVGSGQTPASASGLAGSPSTSVRRFRPAVPVRVHVEKGRPVRVVRSERTDSHTGTGTITTAAGPWRTSGHWWTSDALSWDRDEWDVALETGVVYRIARDRQTDRWELEGDVD